ncbi:MAG: hydantoinase/oxoprolinase family protein [Gammaproteobacteria bacterium]|nr:hydantoinase/oxoprolinase family protein [Gammaproteobacteria bacterium]
MAFVVATDVGGTCTDTVIVEDGRSVFIGKALSTPPDFAGGVIASIRSAAAVMQTDLDDIFRQTSLFIHGSTVVDNTLLERKGARTGLITTAGFEDTLLVTRGAYGRWSGLSEEGLKHPVATDRPAPLVPFGLIRGVTERVDYKGAVIRKLDENEVEQAVSYLLDEHQVESVAVALLWSFANPIHEQRIRSIIRVRNPDIHVSISSDVAPVPGEYERTSTTVINAYAGQVVNNYINNLQTLLGEFNYRGPVLVMQGYGGLLPAEQAAGRAVNMVECGPVAGVIGSKFLGDGMGDSNIIAADMGGTTFKVGVIQDGEIEYAREPLIDRFHYSVPKIDVASIGAGGGSLITLEQGTGAPLVGPRSAGADPGPICYGLGGTRPTLTDVLLLLGYIDPQHFLNGAMTLDPGNTVRLFREQIAEPLGLPVEEAAIGIFRIANAQVTDLIHKITVEQGLDPRDFVLHAFGGTCPILASAFARELSVQRVIVPYTASVNCAFGLASTDVMHDYSATLTKSAPCPVEEINAIYEPMLKEAADMLDQEGFPPDKMSFRRSVGFRYAMQVHEIITPVRAATPLDDEGLEQLINDFETLYENRYGKGSAYRDAGIEMTQFRLSAAGKIDRPDVAAQAYAGSSPNAALTGRRRIFVNGYDSLTEADVIDFEKLQPGNIIAGPAVIHTPITTIVIQDGQQGQMDGYKNIIIDLR